MKLTYIVAGVAIAGGVVISVLIWRDARAEIQAREIVLQEREKQVADLRDRNVRLTKSLAAPKKAAAEGSEIARLYKKREAMRKQIDALALKDRERKELTPVTQPVEHSPEYWEALHRSAGGRMRDAQAIGMALSEYVHSHEHELPKSLDEIVSELTNRKSGFTGTNQFELVFHGSLDRVKDLPFGDVAIVRSQPWLSPDGKEMRVYGFLDGHSQMIETEAGAAWIKQHVFGPEVER